ncbi:hypothetical protein BGM19_07840 [Streptomyces agglomeratus]|uniref:hypothetical protein n=1 Tax=Streptomyces agglomeratus TaxID=285458 RepID=UPI00086C5D6F|nr:hypothetical protein [Streptomyces agglomeratus]OEJ57889.1 hypothetical protein BGM19_07840 [Streptomyces agglomeratus]
MTEPTPEQLAAGAEKGLSPLVCARLRGETPEELSADAEAFVEAWGEPTPPVPVRRVGGPRGVDVGGGNGSSTIGAGAALYRERHGIDEDESGPVRNPFAINGYTWETR